MSECLGTPSLDQDQDRCPEWCDHGGECAEARDAISRMEAWAEGGWLRVAEAGYPGYDYDPNDPRATER